MLLHMLIIDEGEIIRGPNGNCNHHICITMHSNTQDPFAAFWSNEYVYTGVCEKTWTLRGSGRKKLFSGGKIPKPKLIAVLRFYFVPLKGSYSVVHTSSRLYIVEFGLKS